jgi:hypothetical protein
VLVAAFCRASFGASVADDSASNAAYSAEQDGAWRGENPTSGENLPGADNGGTGFQPWNFAGGFHYPEMSPYGRLNHFIDGVDFPHSAYNNLGPIAFGLTNANLAYGGSTARATRVFSTPLQIGSTVSLEFDNPLLRPFAQFAPSGFGIRLNSGGGPVSQPGVNERLGFFTTSGFNGDNWSTSDSVGLTNLGLSPAQTSAGAKYVFTLTDANAYKLQIISLQGDALLASREGTLKNSESGAIDSLEIVMFENGSGSGQPGAGGTATGEREFFFNHLTVSTPTLTADFDSNGIVDGADFLVWQRQFNTAGPGADGNSDGLVDDADLSIWRATFGANGSSSAMSAPESDSIGFAIFAFVSTVVKFHRTNCVSLFLHGRLHTRNRSRT